MGGRCGDFLVVVVLVAASRMTCQYSTRILIAEIPISSWSS
jgi:hypothetical protein